jgi:lipoate-protein ligase A
MEKWRLLLTSPLHGPMNMAIDEAILTSTIQNNLIPTLRLYAWEPGCLSLGYAQPYKDIDEQRLVENDWDLVRRPTGGRAILHIDEITYSIASPLQNPAVQGSLLESYRRLSGGLIKALEFLGIFANADKEYANNDLQQNHPVCFEVPSSYEITVAGKKLIGSAQSRKMGGVLQHGTLPLVGDIARISRVLKYPDEPSRRIAAERIHDHATTLEEVLHAAISWQTAAEAIIKGFSVALGINLVEAPLSTDELEKADELLKTKYSTREWNRR